MILQWFSLGFAILNIDMEFLDSLIDYEKITTYAYDAMKLGRMRLLLDALGNPQHSFQSVHVAGSRGKGSVCAMTYSILRDAGFSVGLYTSPHLMARSERIRLARKAEERVISEEEVALLVQEVQPVVERLSREGAGRFTFFEVFTALGFLFFKEQRVDIAVVEVGMGGRLDATNVIHPLVAAITPVSYDHTDKLGTTLAQIAREKAEILKQGSAAVISHQAPEAVAEIRRVAQGKGVRLLEVPSLYSYHVVEKREEGSRFHVRAPHRRFEDLFLPLPGEHQMRNALVAVAICDALSEKGVLIGEDSVRKGLARVEWPGRFQRVSKNPAVILDGAQNDASALALKETFLDFYKGRSLCLILGMSSDKEVEAVCKILCPLADEVIVTQAQTVRAMNAEILKVHASFYSKSLRSTSSFLEAILLARDWAGPEDVILIAGSLYLVGEALASLQHHYAYEKS